MLNSADPSQGPGLCAGDSIVNRPAPGLRGASYSFPLSPQSPPGPERAWNPTGVRVGGISVLDRASPPAFGAWTGGKGLGARAYFLKIWRLLGVCVSEQLCCRSIRFPWQLGTGDRECSSRFQRAKGRSSVCCARPLEAMVSQPRLLAPTHSRPRCLSESRGENVSPFQSTLEWATVGAPSATSLRPGPPNTKVGKKVSSGRIRQALSCWIQLRGAGALREAAGRAPGRVGPLGSPAHSSGKAVD